jgi:hypothetical protein
MIFELLRLQMPYGFGEFLVGTQIITAWSNEFNFFPERVCDLFKTLDQIKTILVIEKFSTALELDLFFKGLEKKCHHS